MVYANLRKEKKKCIKVFGLETRRKENTGRWT
jgi:hypothetical protein